MFITGRWAISVLKSSQIWDDIRSKQELRSSSMTRDVRVPNLT